MKVQPERGECKPGSLGTGGSPQRHREKRKKRRGRPPNVLKGRSLPYASMFGCDLQMEKPELPAYTWRDWPPVLTPVQLV